MCILFFFFIYNYMLHELREFSITIIITFYNYAK